MSYMYRQPEIKNPRSRSDWNKRASSGRSYELASARGPVPGRNDLTLVILFFGVAAELLVPWTVIWLSDLFVFDVPVWAAWAIFGGPLALGLLVLVVYRALRTLVREPARSS